LAKAAVVTQRAKVRKADLMRFIWISLAVVADRFLRSMNTEAVREFCATF
jgi:hypothetical protein